ncbi:hypothetical protein ACRAVF_14510 [Bradyrhizobium oligotrophicum S58]
MGRSVDRGCDAQASRTRESDSRLGARCGKEGLDGGIQPARAGVLDLRFLPMGRMPMATKLDDLLPAIIKTGNAGLKKGEIDKKFVGKSKERAAELRDRLTTLVRDGEVRGPFKSGRSLYYFGSGYGPSVETASQAIAKLIASSGVKLISKPSLEKKVTGMNKKFFADGLKLATSSRAIVELTCGKSKYFLHRDVAADYLGFDDSASELQRTPRPADGVPVSALTLDDVLPAYRRLKAEQGGFSAVKIYDLMKTVDGSKEELHRLLIEETKSGRVTIHPTTTADLPREEMEAGIRLAGFPEPFVTVVVKNES